MPETTPAAAAPVTETEAFEALKQIAGRRSHPIPTDLLARHALELPGTWDWPVRRAAFEAILRRLASARAQEIAVLERPRSGPWGRYVLGRPEVEGAISYDVRLVAGQPLRGSCDCADFLRGSLGLCKHVLRRPSGMPVGRAPPTFAAGASTSWLSSPGLWSATT